MKTKRDAGRQNQKTKGDGGNEAYVQTTEWQKWGEDLVRVWVYGLLTPLITDRLA